MTPGTEGFKLGVIAATGGIALLYLVEMILGGFFRIQVPAINGSGIVGIGFSLFVVVIAALNLVLDFDMIETGVRCGAPTFLALLGRPFPSVPSLRPTPPQHSPPFPRP